MVTMETFDLGVSFYGNKHGTPIDVKLNISANNLCIYIQYFTS